MRRVPRPGARLGSFLPDVRPRPAVTGRRTGRSRGRVVIRLLALVATILILAAASPSATPESPSPEPSSTPSPGATLGPEPGVTARPLVFAYYYIWYTPTSWNRAKTDLPTLGAYDSADRTVIAQHMAWAKQAGIDALIVSWKHQPR